MPKIFRCLVAPLPILLCLLLSACIENGPVEIKRSILVFGTIVEITIINTDQQTANRALDKLEIDLQRSNENWNPWQGSALTRTNQLLQTGSKFTLAPSVLPLIRNSIKLSKKSEGLYNPSINKLIRLWQFHKHNEPGHKPPLDVEILETLKLKPSMSDLILDGISLRSSNINIEFNFGAYAKGFAVDRAIENFKKEGIKNAIVNAGGDMRVIGDHGDRPWYIGIQHPREKGAIAWIEAHHDEGVFTSGDYERFYMHKGKRYHHILDPRTGYPSTDTQSVTVIDNNAGLADAAATALFIAGPDSWHRIAKSMGIRYVMLIDSTGIIHMNPRMAERIKFTKPSQANIILSQPL